MKITKAEFVISAVSPKQYPSSSQPEIALVGRSNVGKSSLINKIINRKGLARTSSQPGKTQTLNFYHINEAWFFVDLPGYGFAKVPKSEKARWGKFIDEYLAKREQLAGVIQLIDIRHAPTELDILMADWIKHSGLPFIIAATKADKISRAKWAAQKDLILRKLKLEADFPIIVFSSEKEVGLTELVKWLDDRLLLEYEDQNNENIIEGVKNCATESLQISDK